MSYADLTNDVFTVDTGALRRRYRWNGGHLVSLSLELTAGEHSWRFAGDRPDLSLPGLVDVPADGRFVVHEVAATAVAPARTDVEVQCRIGELSIRRVFRIYDGLQAIACDLYFQGTLAHDWSSNPDDPASHANIESKNHGGHRPDCPIMDRLATDRRHLHLQAIRFYDVTDRRNTLVESTTLLPFNSADAKYFDPLHGNLLLINDKFAQDSLFVLREAPCSDVQLCPPPADFICRDGEILVAGLGLHSDDLSTDEWIRGYGFVVGAAHGTDLELSTLTALRSYQTQLRNREAAGDRMVLVNTWGDRSMDGAMSESFALAELAAAKRLGASHLQLDDGWQKGLAHNVDGKGSLARIWDRDDYWSVRPEAFPNGLAPVVERSRELGVELALWFNPSRDDSYAHWRDDANALVRLHEEYGIRVFKIDGLDIPDKTADRRVRAIFDDVLARTDGRVVFNLDVTAMRRGGYHYFNEYGTIFLENRYTDWSNYYPHRTLRNLWMLARYMPSQALQIEFLNVWRNPDKYGADDPLAPQKVPFAYCFATTTPAQPLCWFEASKLPEEGFGIADLVMRYREHQESMHAGDILPIGEEPSGYSWTGFQSRQESAGYIWVFREHNERPTAELRLWGLASCELKLTCIAGNGEDDHVSVSSHGQLKFALPAPFSFAIFRYTVVDSKEQL